MFYAHFVLAKKGPLARIWLAAHWDKKLTKAHVFETNIEKSVDGILQPKVKMALRTSGHLLLGVVRIYSRKTKYLLQDCNEAFVKIKMAFRPGMVDLPEENREAALNAITLPEVFHDFDTAMPELNEVDIEAQFSLNQTRAEEITMREDYGTLTLMQINDEGFGDMGFGAPPPHVMRDDVTTLDMPGSFEKGEGALLFEEGAGVLDPPPQLMDISTGEMPQDHSLEQMRQNADAITISEPVPQPSSMSLEEDRMHDLTGQLFEGGLFIEPPMGEITNVDVDSEQNELQAPPSVPDTHVSEDMDRYEPLPSIEPDLNEETSRPPSALPQTENNIEMHQNDIEQERQKGGEIDVEKPTETMQIEEIQPPASVAPMDQTTLLQNEADSFALAPVDTSVIKGFTKAKRKRKLIVDEIKNISGEEMKNQLSDTSDIVTTLDLAPPTRRLMHWKETGGVEKLFALPARPIPARVLFQHYQKHLTSRSFGPEDFSILGEAELIRVEQVREAQTQKEDVEDISIAKRLSRKRKQPGESPARVVSPVAVPEKVQALDITSVSSINEQEPQLLPPPTPVSSIRLDITGFETSQEKQLEMAPPQTPQLAQPHTPLAQTEEQRLHGSQTPERPQQISTPVPCNLESGADQQVDATSSLFQQQLDSSKQLHDFPSDVVNQQEMNELHRAQHDMDNPPPTPISTVPLDIIPPSTPALMAGIEHIQAIPSTSMPQTPSVGLAGILGVDIPQLPPGDVEEVLQEATRTRGLTTMNMHGGEIAMENMGYNIYEEPQQHVEEYDLSPADQELVEQQQDETVEEFEERVLNKRAAQLFYLVRNRFSRKDTPFPFSEMIPRNNAKQVAQKFYSCLVLKKVQVLDIEQTGPYDEIFLSKGKNFDNPTL